MGKEEVTSTHTEILNGNGNGNGKRNGDGNGNGPSPAASAPRSASPSGRSLKENLSRRPLPEGEARVVVVQRRLYRSGESMYLIDGMAVDLRGIQEVFLGTGLGPRSY